MKARPIVPVILSGGSGTRLWPLSSPARPKQFHSLTGGPTMLQLTAARVNEPDRFAAPIIVAGVHHLATIVAQLSAAGVPPPLLILEPCSRNTAPAIALAALEADPESLLLVMPSDHIIERPELFLDAVAAAVPHAQAGFLVTFGITPTSAETGYGYIKRGLELGGGAWAVARFEEKPDAQRAAHYVASGSYDWNGGIFLFRVRDFLAGLERHAPDILRAVRSAALSARRESGCVYPDAALFAASRAESVDRALFELHDRVAVVPVDMGWSDVGSWDALYALAVKDDLGNATIGPVSAKGARNCLLHSSGPQLLTIGCEDLIVVATAEGVLVLPRGQSQSIKDAVAELEGQASPQNR